MNKLTPEDEEQCRKAIRAALYYLIKTGRFSSDMTDEQVEALRE